MRIACIGGGPAGLYLGILVKRQAPEHEVVVYERNRPTDTFGFGVVFSDATLGHLAAADPETHGQITARFARWDDIEIHMGGEVLRSTGHGFCGIERKLLLEILQTRARALGVEVRYEHEVRALSDVRADVIVACDGVGSWVRDALAADLQPSVDVRPNSFVWLGTTKPLHAFTFIFKQTRFGLFRVHAYPFRADMSTFIVECRDRNLEPADLQDVFKDELGEYKLVENKSIWRHFPTVRCGKWHAGNVVLVGDAVHTAHFSIGSGTKLAMEDAIVLRDELLATTDVSAALARYEARRRPEVEALQAAAQASLEWFEGTERYLHMPPVQFAYSLMTRSLRVTHASMHKRDPHLAKGVEAMFGGAPGSAPFSLGERTWPSRTVPLDRVARIDTRGLDETTLAAAIGKVTGDLLLLDPGDDEVAIETLPAMVATAAKTWQPWIAAVVRDRPHARAAVVGHAAQLKRAGADLLWLLGDTRLSDRVRNDIRIPTALPADQVSDADAAIGAGRVDLIVPS